MITLKTIHVLIKLSSAPTVFADIILPSPWTIILGFLFAALVFNCSMSEKAASHPVHWEGCWPWLSSRGFGCPP